MVVDTFGLALGGREPALFSPGENPADQEDRTLQHRRCGMSPQDALRAARLSFGSVDGTIEACRDQRGVPVVETILQDLRFALRSLLNRPGFSLTVVSTLGLGIGATALMFSVVKAVLIEPLPYPESHRLVWGWGQFERGDRASVSPADSSTIAPRPAASPS